jgi:hypothetical protein
MSRAREFADLAGSADAGGITGKNLIINGSCIISQRGASANTSGSGQYKATDRFAWFQENTDQVIATISQDTNAPDGFSNSHKIAISTAETTLDSDEIAGVYQPIEGQNLQHLKFGTSNAKSLTLSFWVKSTETGTYAVLFYLADGTARGITKNYTINTANTWEYKTITIDGDTSGTIDNDNGLGMGVYWVLSSGSGRGTVDGSSWRNYDANQFGYGHTADVLTDSSATWQITGVQLEVGNTATDFQHLSFADELRRCQRYFSVFGDTASVAARFPMYQYDASYRSETFYHKPELRTAPTVSQIAHTGANTGTVNTNTSNVAHIYRAIAATSGTSNYLSSVTFDAEL